MLADLTRQLTDHLIEQVKKEENKLRLQQHLVDPTIKYILDKLFPYLVGCAVVFILIILLTLVVVFLLANGSLSRKVGMHVSLPSVPVPAD